MSNKTIDDLQYDSVMLGGMLDAIWVLLDNPEKEARNGMMPIVDAARKMSAQLSHELDQFEQGSNK